MELCDDCQHLIYDEELAADICNMDLDEDEYYRLVNNKQCPFYRRGDDYTLARHQ